MSDKKCETDCREDLLGRIGERITKLSMMKMTALIVTIIITLWGIGYTISSKDVARREAVIAANTAAIVISKERMATVTKAIENIEKTQMIILQEIRKR